MMRLTLALGVLALIGVGTATAGTACNTRSATPIELADAAATALRARSALEQANAPVALLSRVGTDLSEHGLTYSHLGFVVRDHHAGPWTVVHLLNRCGTDRSALFHEGLLNYFADDLISFDTRISWLRPEMAAEMARALASDLPFRLHEPSYSVIARFDSANYQNSTSWMLDVLMGVQLDGPVDRPRAQALARAQGFEPDLIRIPYTRRLAGGLFAANANFSDHPVATRLSGRYPVVTVRAILRHLDAQGQIQREREWRSGVEVAQQ